MQLTCNEEEGIEILAENIKRINSFEGTFSDRSTQTNYTEEKWS